MTRRSVAYRRTEYNGQQVAGETNDCAVRADRRRQHLPAGHTMLRTRCGRRNRKGTCSLSLHDLLDGKIGSVAADMGCTFERVHSTQRAMKWTGRGYRMTRNGGVSLARFAREHSTGTYYVLKSGPRLCTGGRRGGGHLGARPPLHRDRRVARAPCSCTGSALHQLLHRRQLLPPPPHQLLPLSPPTSAPRGTTSAWAGRSWWHCRPAGARAELQRRGRCPDTGKRVRR